MCGIYGSTIKYSDEIIRAKLSLANHRGPDYSAFEHIGEVTLGHNRLAILDLDSRSNQPFTYLHLKIVFNGEIYNYLSLKAKLEKKGYNFSTTSDTEVICAAYLEYGDECVNSFNGMFSFVIYDIRKNKLFGARDRLGKKPFYYCHTGYSFEFASQSSQLKIERNFTLDQQAVNEYFFWGYIPEPRSIWQEVNQLSAGTRFTYQLSSGSLNIEKYWDLDYNRTNKFTGGYMEAKRTLKELLQDAVAIRMHADVPLGVFLSGGIDSSLIAALASRKVNHVKTFSIKFNEKGFDESSYARLVASYLRTEHQTIECNYNEGIDLINDFSKYYDEPFADSSAIPTMLLSKYTRKKVTVALSGDGGDEAFIGYSRYRWIKLVNNLFKLPLPVRQSLGSIVKLSPNYVHKLIAMGISIKDIEVLYIRMFGGMENSWIAEPDKGMGNPFRSIFDDKSKNLLETLSDFDIKTYLNGDINTKVDRASMAFSLESRAPLMDYRIIEFTRSLPTHFKYYQGNQKRILKDVLYEYLPPDLFKRPKAGFTMPFKEWFRKELKEYVMDNLSKQELEKIPGINVKRTQEIIQEHMTGKWNRYPQIWKILVFSQWLKKQVSSPVFETHK
ncbi:asparagine synthase (glutamine-hydrolyzing) [Arcticibacter eurypsychrophilus]|uniref:asparagine synthase (glutamine-hydrolyzing) n=1 Tax=Arcticibacter eurypsychrophilus TaxID=1434752 RepID=UPI00084D0FE2|nr:asparagine synthase (glutamine-hydrolyzing) [Arcticibacter eurypsychrophilus]